MQQNAAVMCFDFKWRRLLDKLGGGHIDFIYSCSAQLISFEIDSILICDHDDRNMFCFMSICLYEE